MLAGRTTFILAAMGLCACQGDIGGDRLAPPPEEMEPKSVPAQPELLPSDGHCVALAAGEKLAGVTAEGHAWLVTPQTEGVHVRVIDGFAPEAIVEADLQLGEPQQLVPRSAGDASAIVDGALWDLEGLARVQLTPPDGFAAPSALCGNPADNGFVLADGKLYEHRSDQWWVWNPGVEGDDAPRSMLSLDGECVGTDSVLWLASANGTFWRVEPAAVTTPVWFDGFVQGAATAGIVAALDPERLWVGPSAWQPWIFPGPVPAELSASDGKVWMVSGAQLLRFDGQSFVEVTHAMSEPIQHIAAHAGGVWLAGDSNVCHQAVAPMIRIDGLRPFERSGELEHAFSVVTSTMSASATLDDELLELTFDEELGVLTGVGRLHQVGWHRFQFDAEGATRSLWIKRTPEVERSWATDIAPIYEAHCKSCHKVGSTDPPELSTYDAWKGRAAQLRVRVVQDQSMPPESSRGPEWGDDQVQIILEWLEGGMLP